MPRVEILCAEDMDVLGRGWFPFLRGLGAGLGDEVMGTAFNGLTLLLLIGLFLIGIWHRHELKEFDRREAEKLKRNKK